MNSSDPERGRFWSLSRELMLVAGPDGAILSANPSWPGLLGWDETELKGMKFVALAHPEDQPAAVEAMVRLGHAQPVDGLELRCRHKDGSYRRVSWTAAASEEKLYAVGRMAAPKQGDLAAAQECREQATDAVARFAGIVGHDYNNLLQGIAGSLELVRMLIKLGRAEETEKFIAAAESSIKRAAGLGERLHDFSSRGGAAPSPVDVNALIDSMQDLLRSSLPGSVTLDVVPATDASKVLCDARQLEKAILNLVSNARDAMPDGGKIVIETRNIAVDGEDAARMDAMAPGQYLCIEVTDQGTGMNEAALRQAFDPLFTTKRTGLVGGLGLATVYRFARRALGGVRIRSDVGAGTSVRLCLPQHGGG
ncbi:MAG TPA: ATP-binding protein [Burkholderiales bacterium]